MNHPHIVSRDQWLAARQDLLLKEKAATHARDRLNAERRRLPMVKIDKIYRFEGPDGQVSLLDLFDGRRQLIVDHFMFDPSWEDGCPNCSSTVDSMPTNLLKHLHARNTSLVLISRAPLAKLEAYRRRRNWTMPWFSSYGSEFNHDFGYTNDEGEQQGFSVFFREGQEVLHTYSTTGRGVDILLPTYNFLDLTPLGRQEEWEERPTGSWSPSQE
jgi:predicted dithiol-disulfide oxidoreductase (DUF899 family)